MSRRLLLAALLVLALPTAAQAHYRYFHLHVDAYDIYPGASYNCQYAVWNDLTAMCSGFAKTDTNSGKMGGANYVSWCPTSRAHECLPEGHRHLKAPHGFSRWMEFCAWGGQGVCHDWIVGAVKMPNGPFRIAAGVFEGHALKESDANESRVAQQGSPLFLHVGFHGHISQGGGVPAKTGYVFGIRGWLEW